MADPIDHTEQVCKLMARSKALEQRVRQLQAEKEQLHKERKTLKREVQELKAEKERLHEAREKQTRASAA